jgi:hypothetical protein
MNYFMETSIYYRFIMHNPITHSPSMHNPIMHNQTVHNPMCMEGDLVANIALAARIALVAER